LTDPDHDAHAAFAQFSYIPVIVVTTHRKRVVTFPAPGYPLLIRPLPSPPVDTSIVNLRASLLDLEHDETFDGSRPLAFTFVHNKATLVRGATKQGKTVDNFGIIKSNLTSSHQQ
jgi:hypothetical protein